MTSTVDIRLTIPDDAPAGLRFADGSKAADFPLAHLTTPRRAARIEARMSLPIQDFPFPHDGRHRVDLITDGKRLYGPASLPPMFGRHQERASDQAQRYISWVCNPSSGLSQEARADILAAPHTHLVLALDRAWRPIPEPAWVVKVSDPFSVLPRAVSAHLHLDPASVQTTAAGPAVVLFRADRQADADAFIGALRTGNGYTPRFRSEDKCEIHLAEAFSFDDLTASARCTAEALTICGHRLLPFSGRRTTELWVEMRAAASSILSRADAVRFAETAERLVRHAALPPGEDARWLERARQKSALLSGRLQREPDQAGPAPETVLEPADADLLLAVSGVI